MGNITANLSRHEFACNCGCGFDSMDVETVRLVQDVCDHFLCIVIINSGCRCYEYNRSIGSTDSSQHTKARACDCDFKGPTVQEVHDYLTDKYAGRFGFGVYETFNHIDTRSGPQARWDQR